MVKRMGVSQLPLHMMVLPGLILVIIFCYVPMAGNIIAFQDFIPAKGFFGKQDWVGLDNFLYLMKLPDTKEIIWNTFYISFMKVIANLIVPVTFSLLLNEVRKSWFKRITQTVIYLPNFLSWVIMAGILIDILSPDKGIFNRLLGLFGIQPIYFLGDNKWFPVTIIVTDVLKQFGFSTVIFMAALTGIDPSLYDATAIDGSSRWQQTLHVTLPGMLPIIVLVATLSLGSILNAGFDQIFNLYSPQVYESGDIIDTFTYRVGLIDAQYGLATAVGLFKSVVSCTLISISYYLAHRLADYRIF